MATPDTKNTILMAAKAALMETGYAGLSTRKVAEAAGVPLSQIHYHFGSRHNLVLALLEWENERLIDRQTGMFRSDMPIWKQWEQACDYLEDDLASGYVRLLQEMMAAGWTDGGVAKAVRRILSTWFDLLTDTAAEAQMRLGNSSPFTAAEIAVLAGVAFLGAEELILLGFEESQLPARAALRRIGTVIRTIEETP